MRRLLPLALAALASLPTACTYVSSKTPLGSAPVELTAEDWNGSWACGFSSPVTLKTTAEGDLDMVYMTDDDGQLTANQLTWTIKQHGDWTFASAEFPEQPGEFIWVRIWREEQQLIAWLPAPLVLAARVQAGELPGEVDESGNVRLGELTPEALDVLTAGELSSSIIWQQPIAFVRISSVVGLR